MLNEFLVKKELKKVVRKEKELIGGNTDERWEAIRLINSIDRWLLNLCVDGKIIFSQLQDLLEEHKKWREEEETEKDS